MKAKNKTMQTQNNQGFPYTFWQSKISGAPILIKRPITFIELLIAMVLSSLVLSVLFYFYRDIDWLNHEMEKSQKKSFELSYIQTRLGDVIPNIVSPRIAPEDFYFFVSHDANGLLKPGQPSLVFTYNFGANLNPVFAQHVLARLYIDSYNRLCLAMLPSVKEWPKFTSVPIKQEVLLENVESIAFEFYVPPAKESSAAGNKAPKGGYGNGKKQAQKLQLRDTWYTDWRQEFYQLPSLLRISVHIKDKKDPILFVYPLPQSDFVVIYEK